MNAIQVVEEGGLMVIGRMMVVVFTHCVFTAAEKGIFGLFYASKHNRVASFKNSYFSVVNLVTFPINSHCTNDPIFE